MARKLKGEMPRILTDHRSALAKRLREVYDDLGAKFSLADGISRRVAVMAADSWVDFEDLSQEAARLKEKRVRRNGKASLDVSRVRRQRGKCASQFISGLRTLGDLAQPNGQGVDLDAELEKQEQGG